MTAFVGLIQQPAHAQADVETPTVLSAEAATSTTAELEGDFHELGHLLSVESHGMQGDEPAASSAAGRAIGSGDSAVGMTADYSLTQVSASSEIEEQQWARGSVLNFSTFTSCIGVVGRKGGELTGVHLVVVGKEGNVFDAAAAQEVAALMAGSDEIAIFGFTDIWEDNVPAYSNLTSLTPTPSITNTGGKEVKYQVFVDNGKIRIRTLC